MSIFYKTFNVKKLINLQDYGVLGESGMHKKHKNE